MALRKRAILIVEDEFLIRNAAAGFLAGEYDVYQAADARTAMRILGERFVDLVFADVEIQGEVNGFELAQWIEINYPSVSVIMTSGVSPDKKYGEGPLIEKPYDLDYVRKRIAAVFLSKDTGR
jgi:DNA-binding NtrC family response regulator